jgi:hypothetical protein
MSNSSMSFGRALVLTAMMVITCPVATCSVHASGLDIASAQGATALAGLMVASPTPDYATALYIEPQQDCWNDTRLIGYSKNGKALHKTFLICE